MYNYYPNTRGVIIKTDINGNKLYQIDLGTGTGLIQSNQPQFIESTFDGGIIYCGNFDGFGSNDVLVTKLNACGDVEWCRIFRTDSWPDWGLVIHQLTDGGYIMLTTQYAGFARYERAHLFRFDNAGNVLWIQQYLKDQDHPRIKNEFIEDVIVTASGDYFMTGWAYWLDSVPPGYMRVKSTTLLADQNREEEWVSLYRREDTEEYSGSVNSTQKDSNHFYTGAVYRPPDGDFPMLLVYDSLGNLLLDTLPQIPNIGNKWAEGYLLHSMFTADIRLFAQTLMVDSTNRWPGWYSIHELDTLGGWINTFLHPTAHYSAHSIMTSDEKILAGAVVGSEYDQDIILMKFNTSLQYDSIYTVPRTYDYLCADSVVSKTIDYSVCEVIVNVEDIPSRDDYYKSIKTIPITPTTNPASDEVRFMLKNTEHHKNISIICYDIHGRKIDSVPVNSGTDESKINVSSWTPGMYVAVVYASGKKVGSCRFIVK
jgi:hypothetical protein